MIDKNKKNYFVYDSSRKTCFRGFHYQSWTDKIEDHKKGYYSEDDVEKVKNDIGESLYKRISGLRIGTCLKLHYLHSIGDLMIRRLSDDEVNLICEKENIEQELKLVKEEIKKYIPEELKEKLLKLEKKQRQLNKKK